MQSSGSRVCGLSSCSALATLFGVVWDLVP